jgi:Ca2+-transporting ATPase
MLKMLRESSVISAGGLAAYGYGLSRYGASPQAGTMAFMGLGLAQLLHSVSCRSENSSIFDAEKRPANKYLNVAVGGSIALQLLCPFIPGLKGLLGLAPINLIDGLVIGASAALPLIINETLKKADDSLVVSTRPLLV